MKTEKARLLAAVITAIILMLIPLRSFGGQNGSGFYIGTVFYPSEADAEGSGWSYSAAEGLLYINGFEGSAICIADPGVSLAAEGENTLTALEGPEDGALNLTVLKDSSLKLRPDEDLSAVSSDGKTAVKASTLNIFLEAGSVADMIGADKLSASGGWGGDAVYADYLNVYAPDAQGAAAELWLKGGKGSLGCGAAVMRSPQAPAGTLSEPSVSIFGNVYVMLTSGEQDTPCIGSSPFILYDSTLEYIQKAKSKALPYSVTIFPQGYQPSSEDRDSTALNFESLILAVKKTKSLKVITCGYDGSQAEEEAIWTSSAPHVAEVSSKGLVTAKAPGRAVITAKLASGKSLACIVEVTQPAASVKAAKSSLYAAVSAGPVTVPLVITDKTGEARWELQTEFDKAYIQNAYVDGDDLLVILPGSKSTSRTKVIVRDSVSGKYTSVSVKIGPAADCVKTTLKSTQVNAVAGKYVSLRALSSIEDGSAKPVTTSVVWSSSDPSVAEVSASGKVKAVSPGTCIITASVPSGCGEGSLDFTVKTVPQLKSFKLYQESGAKASSVKASAGDVIDMSSYITESSIVWAKEYPGFDDFEISYRLSAKASAAELSEDGLLSCLGPGTAKVYVYITCGSQKKSAYMTVKITE